MHFFSTDPWRPLQALCIYLACWGTDTRYLVYDTLVLKYGCGRPSSKVHGPLHSRVRCREWMHFYDSSYKLYCGPRALHTISLASPHYIAPRVRCRWRQGLVMKTDLGDEPKTTALEVRILSSTPTMSTPKYRGKSTSEARSLELSSCLPVCSCLCP